MSYLYRQSSFVTSECQGEVHNLVKHKQCPSFKFLVLDPLLISHNQVQAPCPSSQDTDGIQFKQCPTLCSLGYGRLGQDSYVNDAL